MEKGRTTEVSIISILKYVILLLIILFTVWLFWRENPSGTVFDVVTANLESSGFMDDMESQFAEEGQMLFGISADDCLKFYYAATAGQGDAVELVVVQTGDDRNSERVIKAMNNRIESQMSIFEKDNTEQTALLRNAVVKRQGTYILYAVSENAMSLENEFLKSLK